MRVSMAAAALMLASCGGGNVGDGATGGGGTVVVPTPTPTPTPSPSPSAAPVTNVARQIVAAFDSPWAMTFLPDGRMLVTEVAGRLRLVTTDGTVSAPLGGVPAVAGGSQGGLLDVALDPGFATNRRLYLTYSESAEGARRLAVARATLSADASRIENATPIWRNRATSGGHFGGRMAFAPDGTLYVTAGERQQGTPAQDRGQALGKIVRIRTDGTVPADNPFAGTAGTLAEIWTLGHRNPYGLVFAADGRLFSSEMGPEGGDEFNRIERGRNYGWPSVSEGSDYGGGAIPRHSTAPQFAAPLVSWTPVIAPGGMVQLRSARFTGWTGDFILAGLVQQGIVRVRVEGDTAREVQRIPLGNRIREVEEGPDGAIWVLEDGAGGRLVRLTPAP